MTTVVVTGATGFLGRSVVAALALKAVKVVAVSRQQGPGLLQVRHYSETPAGDVVLHLAEAAVRGDANDDADGRRTVDALIGRFGAVVYASSATVYGDLYERPCAVGDPTLGRDAYSLAKLRNEESVMAAQGTVVRLSNLVGPGGTAGTVVNDVMQQIPGTGSLVVRDTSAVRDFLAVSDAASAFASLGDCPVSGCFNVGSGIGTSIFELATTTLALAGEGRRPVVATRPLPVRPSRLVLEVAATTRKLGWAPGTPLAEALSDILKSRRG